MPLAPYVWQLSDFLTATRLNGEMFGAGFAPGGIGFHAAKPVYASGLSVSPALTSGSWTATGQFISADALNAAVRADTAAIWGSRMDPGQNATVRLQLPNSGGAAGVAGGLGLMSVFIPVTSGV